MIIHNNVRSSGRPQEIEITPNAVFVATNIQSYSKTIDDYTEQGYVYDYIEYTRDEYTILQNEKISNLEQELVAAKILLGVE